MKSLSLYAISLAITTMIFSSSGEAQSLRSGNHSPVLRDLNLFSTRAIHRRARAGFPLMPTEVYASVNQSGINALAAANPVIGSGRSGQIAKWSGVFGTNTFTLGNSAITEDKFGKIGIGTANPSSPLTVVGLIETLNPAGGIKFPDGTIQATSATGALFSIPHDVTLAGDGNAGSPLRVAVPLTLSGTVPGAGIINVSNLDPFGSAVIAFGANTSTAAGGTGVEALGGNAEGEFGGTGLNARGGNSNGGTGGIGIVAFGGLSSIEAGVGVIARGGPSSTGVAGAGVSALGGTNNINPGGEGVNATGGRSASGRGGSGVTGIGGLSDDSTGGAGVTGFGGGSSNADGGVGLHGIGGEINNTLFAGAGVRAEGGDSTAGHGGSGVRATGGLGPLGNGRAGQFFGDVEITGVLSKGGGSFKIDHPLDPQNRYLSHSFVESPDMKNIYDGMARLDTNGEAVIEMPDWFGALNRDFRYLLTPMGAPMPGLYIAEELRDNRFRISGGAPGMKVSWQVTGIRQDGWANKNRIRIEEEKPERERGYYLHPEAFDQPEELSVQWVRNPEGLKRRKDARERITKQNRDR